LGGTENSVAPSYKNTLETAGVDPFTVYYFYDILSRLKYITSTYQSLTPAGGSISPSTPPPGVGQWIDPKLADSGRIDTKILNTLSNDIASAANAIVAAFNELFVGISESPQGVGYGSYMTNFQNDLVKLLTVRNTGSSLFNIDQKKIKVELDKNVAEKQRSFNPLSTKRAKVSDDAVKTLAKSIVKEILVYYVTKIENAYNELTIIIGIINSDDKVHNPSKIPMKSIEALKQMADKLKNI
jgi:hypothetical protein